jgi:Spy/CpxP family protein refolding chaperone
MNRLLAVTLVGGTVLAASVFAVRADGEQGRGPRGRHGFDVARMQAELGLSEDQVGQLQKMRSDDRSQAIRRQADLRIAQGELSDLIRAAVVDENAINAKVKQVTDLEAAATRARVNHRLALRQVLTPEQLQKMESSMREHRRDGGPGHRRGPRGSGPGADAAPDSDK